MRSRIDRTDQLGIRPDQRDGCDASGGDAERIVFAEQHLCGQGIAGDIAVEIRQIALRKRVEQDLAFRSDRTEQGESLRRTAGWAHARAMVESW